MAKTETEQTTDLAIREEIAEAIMGGDFSAVYEDPLQAARDIVNRILTADSPEAVLSQGGAIHAQDILGRPFRIKGGAGGIKWLKSSFGKDSPGCFAVLDAEFLDGEQPSEGPVTCGARNVMAQILRLLDLRDNLEERPLKLVEIEGETANGYKPMWLVAA